jgi:hypothetical protein
MSQDSDERENDENDGKQFPEFVHSAHAFWNWQTSRSVVIGGKRTRTGLLL